MSRQGSVVADVKENAVLAENEEKMSEASGDSVPVLKKTSSKGGKKASGKKVAKADPIPEEAENQQGDEIVQSANKEQEDAAEEETEQEAAAAPAQKTKRGTKKVDQAKEKPEEMAPKKGRIASKKEETVDAVAAAEPVAEAAEEETVAEEPVAKGKGGRKPASAAKGKKGKKEEEAEEKEEEQKVEEEEKNEEQAEEEEKEAQEEKEAEEEKETAKPAPKGRGGRKGAAAKPAEKADEPMDEDEEEVAAAPKKGRKASAKATDEEPETKKAKKDEKPAPKGRGKKTVETAEKEEAKEEEEANGEEEKEEKEEKPKGRGGRAAAKKPEPKVEEEEEAEKPAGRPKRGAATKAAANAKKIAEEEEEDAVVKPKRGAKGAAKKTVKYDDDEDEDVEEKPAAKRGKQPAKGRGKGKKAEAAESDEDGPSSSKKVKVEEEEAEDGKSGGKSMAKSIRRTVQVKGKAAVDPLCARKAACAHVYADGDLIYDVMLNQTNIGNNNNKYYVIQLLEEDDKNQYSVWFRWGRVGYDGQNKLVECGTNLQKAIHEFSAKFEAKTRNQWPTAFADFETHHGKYTMIEMDYGSGAGGEGGEAGVKIEDEQEEEEKKCQVESKLDARVQQLMHLMCSIRTMTQAVKQLEFDADKSPLGKLTQQQIKEGYACLGKIEKFIEKKSFGAEFKMAVNEYYTKVPHACGFRPPAMIKTPQLLKSEIELLDLLSDIEYAIKTMKEEVREDDVHPVDRHYASLKCGLAPMEKTFEEYKLVSEYLSKTHGGTHNIQMGLKNVFRVQRDGEDDNEEVMEKVGNRKLLWHGSRLSNFFGILSQGLRIAPPEAPCTGYMFGKGVYFADMATKSGNYCYASEDGQTGFLLLAEVALGEEHQLKQADYNADKLPSGKHSTWGIGRTMPDPSQNKQLNDKVVVPCGRPIANSLGGDASLLYNEFIVYDTAQIRMRYLLEVEFTFL